MADKYIANSAGNLTEKEGKVVSAGAADAGKIPALDAAGRLDNSVMPTGIGADTASITTSEALAAGDMVNIFDSAGNFRVRKADANAVATVAHGFVLAAFASGAAATVYFEGANTGVTSLTPGTKFLSAATPGLVSATAPTGIGDIVQKVGVATAATSLNVETGEPVTLA